MIKSDKKKKKLGPLCSGKKGKVISFKLEATISHTNKQLLHVRSQVVIKNTLIRREVKRWPGVPQKSLPGLLVTDPAPHTRGGSGGAHSEASFCPSWCRCGFQARRSEAEDEGRKAGGLKK